MQLLGLEIVVVMYKVVSLNCIIEVWLHCSHSAIVVLQRNKLYDVLPWQIDNDFGKLL